MPNTIKPKRSNTASKVPNTSELVSGELGVNMADRKVYINNGTTIVQVGAGLLTALGDVVVTSPTNGQSLNYNGTNWVNTTGAGSGTVTSVGITPSTGVTVSNSPITTSGNITVGLSTKLTAIENLSGAGFFTQNGTGVIAGRTIQAGTGISVAHGNGSSQDPVITNSAPDQVVSLTAGSNVTITGTYPSFTIASSGGGGVSQFGLTFNTASTVWTNMPSAVTILFGNASAIQKADLTGYTQCRLLLNKLGVAGNTNSKIVLEFATSYTQTASTYIDIGVTEVSCATTGQNTYVDSGWVNLVAGAKADVFITVTGLNGNGTNDPVFGSIIAMFK